MVIKLDARKIFTGLITNADVVANLLVRIL